MNDLATGAVIGAIVTLLLGLLNWWTNRQIARAQAANVTVQARVAEDQNDRDWIATLRTEIKELKDCIKDLEIENKLLDERVEQGKRERDHIQDQFDKLRNRRAGDRVVAVVPPEGIQNAQ